MVEVEETVVVEDLAGGLLHEERDVVLAFGVLLGLVVEDGSLEEDAGAEGEL